MTPLLLDVLRYSPLFAPRFVCSMLTNFSAVIVHGLAGRREIIVRLIVSASYIFLDRIDAACAISLAATRTVFTTQIMRAARTARRAIDSTDFRGEFAHLSLSLSLSRRDPRYLEKRARRKYRKIDSHVCFFLILFAVFLRFGDSLSVIFQ